MRNVISLIFTAIMLAVLLSITGCSTSFDHIPGIVDRATEVKGGLSINDMLVVRMGAELTTLFDLRVAQYNGASVAGAISQAALAVAIAAIAVNQGSLVAAGSLGAAALGVQQMFGIIQSPAHANAYLGGKKLMVDAQNEYWLQLAESCGPTIVSGTELTDAGVAYLVRVNNAALAVQIHRQTLFPTMEQLQGASVPPGSTTARMRSMEQPCEPDPVQPDARKRKPRASQP